jgi:hypothetical protein
MKQLIISLPDSTCQQLAETVKETKLFRYSPEKWVADLVISELAARHSRAALANLNNIRRFPRLQKAKV